MADITHPTVARVRPHWGAVLTAALTGLLLAHPAGIAPAVIAAVLVLICSAAWQLVALLGYVAGTLTADDGDD